MRKNLAASARDYVMSLDLPEAGPAFEAATAREFSDQREAVAVGAQLAANKVTSQTEDVFRWYDKYIEVLQNIGWQVRDLDFQAQQVSDQDAWVHKEIIPVLALLLGPQAAAASIVIAVLNGLQNMDASSPWITLFDQSSQHARGAKFQVSYVDADAQGHPEISLLCFGIQADRTITQVLFFKTSAQSAEVKKASAKLAVSMERLSAAKDALAGRVQPFIADYVKNIDI